MRCGSNPGTAQPHRRQTLLPGPGQRVPALPFLWVGVTRPGLLQDASTKQTPEDRDSGQVSSDMQMKGEKSSELGTWLWRGRRGSEKPPQREECFLLGTGWRQRRRSSGKTIGDRTVLYQQE